MSSRVMIVAIGLGIVIAVVAFGDDASVPPRTEPEPAPRLPVHGMTVSCPTNGWEWGTDEMVETMEDLATIGVNWITIHPYASIGLDGSVRLYRMRNDSDKRYITRPIEEAQRLGLKMMMKPHLSYWGRFSWRGAIEFDTDEKWRRFFAEYEAWIVDMARLSKGADAFVVGCELEKTTKYEKEWRKIIAAVREVYDGPLTYAANWNNYQSVKFWDALDVVGIQAYFPLIPSGHGEVEPTTERLHAGWRRIMAELRAFKKQTGKDIVFTELGYNESSMAPFAPWKYETGGENAADIQKRCTEVALAAIANEPIVVGAFLWKWFPGGRHARNFAQSRPSIRATIADAWKKQ